MLEGLTNASFWNWNDTIGPLKNRPGMAGVWGYEITQGQGIIEYMHWCDDLGLEPGEWTKPGVLGLCTS